MKANELRIGNYVYAPHLSGNVLIEYDSIYSIFENCVTLNKDKQNALSISEIRPIRLNEEWLNKFGLIKYDEIYDTFFIDFFGQELTVYKSYNVWRIKFYRANQIIDIKYVHKLQNFYFALFGKELKI